MRTETILRQLAESQCKLRENSRVVLEKMEIEVERLAGLEAPPVKRRRA
jgi:hypothetical protein